ncbi:MAG: hypothetical protein JSR46_03525 [Verrucomicrobia bacterium]|nr:hypothetical protein [Verrucomicrobiota bacterium]
METTQSIFHAINDPDRFLPTHDQIAKMQEKAKASNFNKLQKYLTALSESNLSDLFPDDAKTRCIKLIPICTKIIQAKPETKQLVLKVIGKLAACGVFQSEQWKEEIVCTDPDKNGKTFNRDLLMIHSPILANLYSSELEPSTGISFDNAPSHVVDHLKHYLLYQTLDENLSVKTLSALYLLADRWMIDELCLACLTHMNAAACTENAKEHVDTFYDFIQLINGTIVKETPEGAIRDKKRNELIHSFVTKVCEQNRVAYTTSPDNGIRIALSNAYLLRQENGFSKLLQTCIDGFSIETKDDMNCLGQLSLLPSKVERSIQWLRIEQELSTEQLLALIHRFTSLKTLSIAIELPGYKEVFTAITRAKQLKHLHLLLPGLKNVKEEKPAQNGATLFGSFPGFGNTDFRELFPIEATSITYTYTGEECLFFSPEFITFLNTLSTLTVNCKCVVAFTEAPDRDIVAGTMKKRFCKTIMVGTPSNYGNVLTLEPLRKKEWVQPQLAPQGANLFKNFFNDHPFGKFI